MYIVVSVLAGIARVISPPHVEVVETSWFLSIIMLAVVNTAAIVFTGELLSTSEFAYEGERCEFIDFPSSDLNRVTVLSTLIATAPHVVNGFAAIYCIIVGSEGSIILFTVVLATTAYRLLNEYSKWKSRKG